MKLSIDADPTAATGRAPAKSLDVFPSTYRPLALTNFRPWTWFLLDFMLAYVSAAIAFSLTPHSASVYTGATAGDHVNQFPYCLGVAVCISLTAHIAGMHETSQRIRGYALLGYCSVVAFVGLLLINVELLFVHYATVGRLISVFTLFGCIAGMFVVRSLIIEFTSRNSHVVAFVGSRSYTDRALTYVVNQHGQCIRFITHSLDGEEHGDLKSWVLQRGVHEVVIDTNDPDAPSETELLSLVNSNLTVSTYTNFIENLLERVPNDHINAQWIIDSQAGSSLLYKRAFKRLIDIVVAVVALIVLLPFILLAALAVRIDSKGPVVFRQRRVGQFGQPFTMLKLRTMVNNAESNGAQWASATDERITPVGKFLRRSRLDEAPQLLNVIAGSMSLVGPRPEVPAFTAELEKKIPYFINRLLVKPGITGWAQINAGYADSEQASINKLSFDLYYVKMLSFGLDLRILLRTIASFASGSR